METFVGVGTIRCQLAENQLDDAAQHIEFLTELQTTIGKATVSGDVVW